MHTPRTAPILLFAGLAVLLLDADRQAARSEERPIAAAPASIKNAITVKCQPTTFRVVVDVGHTLDVPGAMSARGVPEYAFNLQLAKDIKQALGDGGFDKTELMITPTAPPRGLIERVARANHMAADLFISIHHDSVPDRLLQTWQYEGQENHFNDDYPGYALFVSKDNSNYAGSLQFGRLLGLALEAGGLKYTSHYVLPIMGHRQRVLVDAEAGVYRYDQLIVLRETRMPALLLEAGSIVNRAEELELGSKERRALTSTAVVAAVEDFCAARTHPHGEDVAKHPAPATEHKAAAP
jgi:N-acetylmuramoyl-L-alanine amidase